MNKKRSLFEELKLGIEEINANKAGKITLRTYEVKNKAPLKINPELIRDTREKLHLSRAVFALRLRVSLRTLEKWEQGTTVPNDQAVALILLVRKYPDILERLEKV